MMSRAVFVDRDGVINKVIFKKWKPHSPRKFEEFEFSSGIKRILEHVKSDGYLIIITTNQPDIARGLLTPEDLEKMHALIKQRLPVDDIIVCPHDDGDNCSCRKPKPGMLLDAARKWDIDLNSSFVVGDGWKDMKAGQSAGCTSILLDAPYNQGVECDYRAQDFNEIVAIMERDEKNR